MRILAILIIFMIGSAKAYLKDPPDQEYLIKNVATSKYLFVDTFTTTSTSPGVAKNVCMEANKNKLPDFEEAGVFQLVVNNEIGPYYNIINVGTGTTLTGTDIKVGLEDNHPVYGVAAWVDKDHRNIPQSMWNIRHLGIDLYFVNVYYGSYLYTNDNSESDALLDGGIRLALLMPTEGGGRLQGTQWLLLRRNTIVDERSREEKSKGGEEVVGYVGNVTKGEVKNEK